MPGGETAGAQGRVSPGADREQVIETLKTAFVQGRLGKDEFDHRVGQALAAYAELDALTGDIPVPVPATPPQLTREAYNRRLVARGTVGGAGAIAVLAATVVSAAAGNLALGVVLGGVLGLFTAAILAGLLTILSWVLERGSNGRSSRRTRPHGARVKAAQGQASAERADPARHPARHRARDHRHTAEAAGGRWLSPPLLGAGTAASAM